MEESVRRTVVVSAVNIRKGGTLTILRDCLSYLSENEAGNYRIIAIVHKRELCDYPGIEYIEMPDCIKSWGRRLKAEYFTMNRISRQIAAQDGHKVWLWLSLHDSTPRVQAEHQEVYCHTSFPFMKAKLQDLRMDPKIFIFAYMTRWVYRINVHKNDNIIVQQNWFADAMSGMLGVPREKFRVIPPHSGRGSLQENHATLGPVRGGTACGGVRSEARTFYAENPAPNEALNNYTFLYVSTPDCHKNFETLCQAAQLLEKELGKDKFKVILTIKGDENRYARYLYRHWGGCPSIEFRGVMSRDEIFQAYAETSCFIFPSRIESWGLPISEFKSVQPHGTMILADLPYAHETSGDISQMDVAFFNPADAKELKKLMKEKILQSI